MRKAIGVLLTTIGGFILLVFLGYLLYLSGGIEVMIPSLGALMFLAGIFTLTYPEEE